MHRASRTPRREHPPARAGDMVIGDAPCSLDGGEFLLLDALTRKALTGPFRNLHDALTAARHLRATAHVYREFRDARGRLFGQPLRLLL